MTEHELLAQEKEAMRRDMLQDELHEYQMRTDFDYFCAHSEFYEVQSAFTKFNAKLEHYGWRKDQLKDTLQGVTQCG